MRPRPDPLQRLALLQQQGPAEVANRPPDQLDHDDREREDPLEWSAASDDPAPGGDDLRPDAEIVHRYRNLVGAPGTSPRRASVAAEPRRRHPGGATDPADPDDRTVSAADDLAPPARAPGRHRHRPEAVPTRSATAEMSGDDGHFDNPGVLAFFGGWVPDDGDGDAFRSRQSQSLPSALGENFALPRHHVALGDDGDSAVAGGGTVGQEHHRPDDGNGGDRTDLFGTDDAAGNGPNDAGGIRSGTDGGDGEVEADAGADGDVGDDDRLDDPGEPDGPEIRARRLGNRPWGRLAELWVPESLRDARIDPGRRGLLVLLLVAAVAAVATAIGVWRDRPEPRPVETVALAPVSGISGVAAIQPVPNPAASPVPSAVPTADPAVAATGSTAPPTEIVVSVTGRVTHPGVVTLPVGARVTDAIAAAGGSTAEADLTGLNLAARLADGDSVVIAAAAAGGASSGVSSAGSAGSALTGKGGASAGQQTSSPLIDLNTADEAALDSLPGVGPVMAQNILAWRQQNGRFTSIEQLQEISGIGPARYAQISALVTVS